MLGLTTGVAGIARLGTIDLGLTPGVAGIARLGIIDGTLKAWPIP